MQDPMIRDVGVWDLATAADRLLNPTPNKKRLGRPPGMNPNTTHKMDIAVDMAAMGMTLQEIGDTLGCTREYARQLLKRSGVKKAEWRREEKEEALLSYKFEKRISGFKTRMYEWLYSFNIYHCTLCKDWMYKCNFYPKEFHICRSCGAERMKKLYRTSAEYRKKCRDYARSERGKEVQRRASARYLERLSAEEHRLLNEMKIYRRTDLERYERALERFRELRTANKAKRRLQALK